MELTKVFFGRILICFASGIMIGHLIPIEQGKFLFPFISCLASFLLYLGSYCISRYYQTYTFRFVRGVFAYLLVFILGINLYHLRSPQLDPQHYSKSKFSSFKATLTEGMKPGSNSTKGLFEIEEVKTSTGWKKSNGKVLIYFKQKDLYSPGTTFTFSKIPQKVRPPLNPNQFDYADYLSKKNITHILFIQKNDIIEISANSGFSTNKIVEFFRNELKAIFRQYIPNSSGRALVQGLLLGDKSEMDQEINLRYSQVGLAHILAVSGFHTALIYQILVFVFGATKRISGGRYIHLGLVLLGLWFYVFLTGLSPSAVRAATMLSLLLVTKLLKRQPNNFHILCLAAFGILLFNPNTLFDLGFQLSFCAVWGIFSMNKPLKLLYNPEKKWLKFIWETICISISAQLFTIPIILLYFHQFPLYFLFSNLVTLLPVIGTIYLSLLLLLLNWIPIAAKFIGTLIEFITLFMDSAVTFISSLPTFTDQIYISNIQAILAITTILCFSYGFSQQKIYWIYYSYFFLIAIWSIQQIPILFPSHEQSITIFDIKDHSLIALCNGNTAWIYTDLPEAQNNPKIKALCNDYLGTKHIKTISYHTITGNTQIKAWGKLIHINDGKSEFIPADYQILHNYKGKVNSYLAGLNNLIIDGSSKLFHKTSESPFYQTSVSGALTEKF